MSNQETTNNQGLFGTIYSADKNQERQANKGFVERRLKRKFQVAADSAEEQKLTAEAKLAGLRKTVQDGELDLNAVLIQQQVIRDASATQAAIAEEYKIMFGEDLANR
jgi:hypothetical protein